MATDLADKAVMEMEVEVNHEEDNNGGDLVSIDLPAPQGWTKKFIPKKGGTPRRNEIVFIAPSGEEIKNKRQLDQYLKSHPGGPSASEFDWGTGDTPRRSARLSSKPKATETPESVPSRKRQKKSSSKKEDKKDGTDGEGESAEDEAAAKKSDNANDVEMKDTEVAVDHSEDENAKETAADSAAAKVPVENTDEKTDESKQGEEAGGVALPGGKEVQREESMVQEEHAYAKALEVTLSGKGAEQPEENKVGIDEKQADVEVPQEPFPSKGDEHSDETKSGANAIHSNPELQKLSNNVVEEQLREAKHALNSEINNAMHGDAKEVPNNAEEEQPAEVKEAPDNAMEEQPGETKDASNNGAEALSGENKVGNDAIKEQPGETTDVPIEKVAEAPDVPGFSPNTSVEKDVKEATLANSGTETNGEQGTPAENKGQF